MPFDVDSFAVVVTNGDNDRKRNWVDGDGLTRSERAVLCGLEAAIERYANPSLAEIAECAGDGIYASGVHKYLRQLAAKGWVELPLPRRTRGVRLIKRNRG